MVTSSTDNVYNKCTQFGSWTFHSHYIDQQQKKTGHQLGRRQLLRINTTYDNLKLQRPHYILDTSFVSSHTSF